MALKGNLDPTFLSGLFQIFCDEKKTGLFKANFSSTQMDIHIQNGCIVHAACFDGTSFLADMLSVRGALTAAQVDQAVQRAEQTGKSLARSLLDLGFMEEQRLQTFLEEMTRDLLLMLFRQTQGDFEYLDMPLPLEDLVLIHMDIRRAILETFRLLDEIKEFRTRLPKEDLVFAMPDASRKDTAYQLDAVAWRILSLVHAQLPLKQILRKSTYNAHTVYATLIDLLDARMITLTPGWDDDIHEVDKPDGIKTANAAPAEKDPPKEKRLFGFFRKKS